MSASSTEPLKAIRWNLVDEIDGLAYHDLLRLELGAVVVADDVGDVRLFHRAVEGDQVEEPFVAFRVFRALVHGQQGAELLADVEGVLHLTLRVTGVYVPALDMDLGRCGIEVLELQFADLAAVHRVRIVRAEAGDIELHDAAADFLVGGEPDLDGPMLELRVRNDVLDRVHDFRHAALVVGAQECRTVGRDERLAHIMEHFRELGRLQRQARHALERNLPAVIILHDLRLDVRARGVRGRIDMGDETDGRHLRLDIGRNASHHIPELIQRGLHAHRIQLLAQHPQQIQLLRRGRLALRFLIGLCIHSHIPQKTIKYLFHYFLTFIEE